MTNYLLSREFYDTIARYYDAENEEVSGDLALYSSLAEQTGGPILDVGCGTGRVMLHLAMEGHHVDGVDTSSAMLDRGRRKLKNRIDLQDLAVFYESDALTFELPQKYALILIPYNSFMHFRTTSDQLRLLKRLTDGLTPDGLLVIDLPNAGEEFGTIDDNAVSFERSFIEPESGHLVMQQSVSNLNRTEQIQYVTWIYDEIGAENVVKRTVAPLTLRYIFPSELDLLLQVSGLKRIERYGDYEQGPFEDGCERLIVVAGHKRKGS